MLPLVIQKIMIALKQHRSSIEKTIMMQEKVNLILRNGVGFSSFLSYYNHKSTIEDDHFNYKKDYPSRCLVGPIYEQVK